MINTWLIKTKYAEFSLPMVALEFAAEVKLSKNYSKLLKIASTSPDYHSKVCS